MTHDQDEALSLSDRVAILRDGRLLQFDAPATLYERPRSRFVADFLGKSNFLRGRVVGRQDGAFVYACGDLRLVQAHDGPPPPAGSDVLIALRPEKIEIAETPPDTANRLTGVLVDATYLGAEHRLTIEVDGLPEGERRLTVAGVAQPDQAGTGRTGCARVDPRRVDPRRRGRALVVRTTRP